MAFLSSTSALRVYRILLFDVWQNLTYLQASSVARGVAPTLTLLSSMHKLPGHTQALNHSLYRFGDGGRKWTCNLCAFINDVPPGVRYLLQIVADIASFYQCDVAVLCKFGSKWQ
jgi:hypothetical protein